LAPSALGMPARLIGDDIGAMLERDPDWLPLISKG
jgi:hypothetical protein